ncbi:MAG: hypothetical protein WAV54_07050 [Acidimicrobiales bacterium]
MQLQHVASRGHVDINDSTNLDQHNNRIHGLRISQGRFLFTGCAV